MIIRRRRTRGGEVEQEKEKENMRRGRRTGG